MIKAADDFELSAHPDYPNGQDILSEGRILIATVTVADNTVTVTRKVDTVGWGTISSASDVSIPFTYTGDIEGSDIRSSVWPASNGPYTITIFGEEFDFAWYSTDHSGVFKFNYFGQPQIQWSYKSPIEPEAVTKLNLSNVVGPGQVLDSDSMYGSVRWWDQSYPEGRDAWESVFGWLDGAPESCDENGFVGMPDRAIPAPQKKGGNEEITEAQRPDRVAYLVLNYTTTITDFEQATDGWDSLMRWNTPRFQATHSMTVFPDSNAIGNRAVKVSNHVSGPEHLFTDKTFEIEVDCTIDTMSATGFPQILEMTSNSQRFVYAPIGSICEIVGDNSHGAEVTTTEPVQITGEIAATFEFTFASVFTGEAELNDPVVTQAMCLVPGTISEPKVVPATDGNGVVYDAPVGEIETGHTVTVRGTVEDPTPPTATDENTELADSGIDNMMFSTPITAAAFVLSRFISVADHTPMVWSFCC